MLTVAKEVFPRKKEEEKSWFDSTCKEARRQALSASEERRHTAFREYKNLIRGRKRRFISERQSLLAEELRRSPQSFWARLRPARTVPELTKVKLQEYIKSLYFVPNKAGMPAPTGAICSFDELEVDDALKRMRMGAAKDLDGIALEMIRWGGKTLLTCTTKFCNDACRLGFPVEWTDQKVIPLYKSGPKHELTSYRTIMIANFFAKLFGTLIDRRLSSWCEDHGVRTEGQAGFRKNYSTTDHSLTLRVLMENAKKCRKPLFLLFVDFRRAFDSVTRSQIWERLHEIGVPEDLRNAIAVLYATVQVKLGRHDEGTPSTQGVIQGCAVSPTLFGLLIDKLFDMIAEISPASGRDFFVPLLIFADDVGFISRDEQSMHDQIKVLETFYELTGLDVNLDKTIWLRMGPPPIIEFKFRNIQIAECSTYKYLGLEVSSDLSWKRCLQSRIAAGFRALYALNAKCDKAELWRGSHQGPEDGTRTFVDGRIGGTCRRLHGRIETFERN
ncbi:hypothetical protein R1sor_027176 [Riccia sorocarpa]|uniref:Reverse transcriptase domain-containing protein n=1 Tax=Riccia sorocarpa TaxID=122646 RepID=A0ABD3GE68_9MARC